MKFCFTKMRVLYRLALFLFLGLGLLPGTVAQTDEAPAQAAPMDGTPKAGKQVEQSKGGDGLRYWLYLPTGHVTTKAWPVLIFLHGVGERGTDLQDVLRHGPPMILARSKAEELRVLKENFIVISPQCRPKTYWFDNGQDLLSVVDTNCSILFWAACICLLELLPHF
jgi:predicted peptidase